MKAAAFELLAPPDLASAMAAMGSADTRPLAGGQSLGPMLNYRVVRPSRLVHLPAQAELRGVQEGSEAVTIGALVTHSAIEDGLAPDIGQGILPRVAAGIAYRAVRNRGTIGGSLCHADPAADWVTVLSALGDSAVLCSAQGKRSLMIGDFVRGPYQTALAPGELLQAVRVPRLKAGDRWGYVKFCRKPGEFAKTMSAVLWQSDRAVRRVVVGALGAVPLLVEAATTIEQVADLIPGDAVARHMAVETLRRAWALTQ